MTPDTLPHPHAARHAVTRMALWGGREREELADERTGEGRSGGEKGGERERGRERERCVGDMESVYLPRKIFVM